MMLPTKSSLALKTYRNISLGYTILVTVLLLMPAGDIFSEAMSIKLPIPSDKIAHACIHFGLAILWLVYIRKRFPAQQRIFHRNVTIASILFYGIIIEAIQHVFVPTRHADAFDVLANVIGLLLGVLLYSLIPKKIVKS
ncbi:VanZ family protein [Flavobacteriaceae bacterium TK19130]|nr:VanZ family protein [Thermobacterium salinum]